jgi:hypothetical protein
MTAPHKYPPSDHKGSPTEIEKYKSPRDGKFNPYLSYQLQNVVSRNTDIPHPKMPV